MHLEDHIGDILRKGRAMANVPAASVAKAAGLTEDELAALEESGRTDKPIQFLPVATLLGLNAAKLQAIGRGWLPAPVDLSTWRELRCITTSDGANGLEFADVTHGLIILDECFANSW